MTQGTTSLCAKDSRLCMTITSSDLVLYAKNGFSQEASTLHRIENLINTSFDKRISIHIAPQEFEIRGVLRDMKLQLIACSAPRAKLRSNSTRFFEQIVSDTQRHVVTPYYNLDSNNGSLNIAFKKLRQPMSSFSDETKEILAIIKKDCPNNITLTFSQRTPQETKKSISI